MNDILACPHCGGKAEVLMGVVTVFVACKTCRSRSGGYRFRWFDNESYQRAEDRAVRSWNRRLKHG